MVHLSIVIPYYSNPEMLSLQYQIWAEYPERLKSSIEIVIVDDGSPFEPAAHVARPLALPRLSIYRVLVDKPWNQHGARNLGARQAEGDWLFLTDMDHVLSAESLEKVVELKERQAVYTFGRLDAPLMTPTLGRRGELKPHPNTFMMTREMFWRIGGYDERWCGIYGTDAFFRRRAKVFAELHHLPDVPVVRFSREIIADASTRTLSRKEGRGDSRRLLMERIEREGSEDQIETLTFPWERVV